MERTDINVIYLWDIRIEEPIVTATDILVSALCFFYFYKLHTSGKDFKTIIYFKFYFLLMGIATTLGGVFGHAFLYAVPFAMKLAGWITSMFSIMLIERSAIEHTKILFPEKVIKVLRWINITELTIFLSLTIYSLNFFFVELHSGYGLMFVVLGLESYLFYKMRHASSKNILIGIGLAAVAALFFMNKWVIHPWFNHISMSHTLMAVAAYFFYRGAQGIDMNLNQET